MNSSISIIIPCYNCQNTIEDTILSILNDQSLTNLEIVAVNDCSTDSTIMVLNRYADRIRIIDKPANEGPSRTRNVGILAAKGEFIAFCDSDDQWEPGKLSMQLKLFADPEVGLVCTDACIFNDSGIVLRSMAALRPLKRGQVRSSLLTSNFVVTSSVVVRKAALVEVGLFDETLRFSEDFDLWLRVSKRYKFNYVPEILVRYRESDKSLSKNIYKMNDSKISIIDNILKADEFTSRKKVLSDCYFRQGMNFFYRREMTSARNRFANSLAYSPFHLKSAGFFCLTLLPVSLVERLKTVISLLK